jgi:hypothetical protein
MPTVTDVDPIRRTLAALTMGDPVRHGPLTMIPLLGSEAKDPGWLTLVEAGDAVTVTEVSEAGTVPFLRVTNDTEQPVLLLDGEELLGAKQNRVLNTTILVTARSTVVIPASCVEQGPWAYRSQRFGSAGTTLFASLRAKKAARVSPLSRPVAKIDKGPSVGENPLYSMPRGGQLARQWRLLQLLDRPQGITVEDAAKALGCAARTIWRDLRVLEDAGFPIHDEPAADGRRGLWRVPKLPLKPTLSEVAALVMSRELLAPLGARVLGLAVATAFRKIADVLSRDAVGLLEQMRETIGVRAVGAKLHVAATAHLPTIQTELLERRTLRMRYHSLQRDAETERDVDPYHLTHFNGGLYLVGYCHLRETVRVFARAHPHPRRSPSPVRPPSRVRCAGVPRQGVGDSPGRPDHGASASRRRPRGTSASTSGIRASASGIFRTGGWR